jgi:hypothetical protein
MTMQTQAWQHAFKLGDRVWYRDDCAPSPGRVTAMIGDRVQVKWSDYETELWHDVNDVYLSRKVD